MGDPNGMNPKFRSTFLTMSTLWVEKINTLQVWRGQIHVVTSEHDTTQKHISIVQFFWIQFSYTWANKMRRRRKKPSTLFSFSRSARGGYPEAQVKVFRAEDPPGARSRQGFNQVKRPSPTWVPCPSIFSKSLLFSSILTVTDLV